MSAVHVIRARRTHTVTAAVVNLNLNKVTDFGLSSVATDVDGARMTYTSIAGPVAWRVPETFHIDDKKRQIASVQTDVYSTLRPCY
jgi:serine/threonine protein kinase